eukprot:scaffold80997_cov57-Phaeocystis_antarctica.AAC.1
MEPRSTTAYRSSSSSLAAHGERYSRVVQGSARGHERVGVGQQVVRVRNGEVALRDVSAAAAAVLDGNVRGLLGLEESLRDEVTHAAALRRRLAGVADPRASLARNALVADVFGHFGYDLSVWKGG